MRLNKELFHGLKIGDKLIFTGTSTNDHVRRVGHYPDDNELVTVSAIDLSSNVIYLIGHKRLVGNTGYSDAWFALPRYNSSILPKNYKGAKVRSNL